MDILQLFIADVVPVAELEVVIVHAECRAEKVAHVGGTPAGKVDVVRETVTESKPEITRTIGEHTIQEVTYTSGYCVDTVLSDTKIKFHQVLKMQRARMIYNSVMAYQPILSAG